MESRDCSGIIMGWRSLNAKLELASRPFTRSRPFVSMNGFSTKSELFLSIGFDSLSNDISRLK